MISNSVFLGIAAISSQSWKPDPTTGIEP